MLQKCICVAWPTANDWPSTVSYFSIERSPTIYLVLEPFRYDFLRCEQSLSAIQKPTCFLNRWYYVDPTLQIIKPPVRTTKTKVRLPAYIPTPGHAIITSVNCGISYCKFLSNDAFVEHKYNMESMWCLGRIWAVCSVRGSRRTRRCGHTVMLR